MKYGNLVSVMKCLAVQVSHEQIIKKAENIQDSENEIKKSFEITS